MMILRYLFLLFASHLTVGAIALEVSGTPDELRDALKPEYPEVTIIGKAERTAYSNLAHITVLVSTKESTISESLAKNAEIRRALAGELTSEGIPKEDVKNSEFSSSPHYGLFRGKKPSKYTIENSLRVTARNENQLLTVNRIIDKVDAAELGQIEFEVENEEELKSELRLEAISNAQTKSQSYGSALGLKLIPKSFSFERGPSRTEYPIEEVVVTAQRSRGAYDTPHSIPVPESVSFEQTEYRATIRVVYESHPEVE